MLNLVAICPRTGQSRQFMCVIHTGANGNLLLVALSTRLPLNINKKYCILLCDNN